MPELKFGAFLTPFASLNTDPTQALEQDLGLIRHLEELGYEYVWVGEHHSGGMELIASPEVFIGMAAAQTKHIKLGASISSVAFQHPLILADRIMQLDHMTRGRVAFCVGPSLLPEDARMMGAQPIEQPERMQAATDVLVPLLRGEPVSRKTDWFEIKGARLQLKSFSKPEIEMAVASQVSPASARSAGTHGLGLLSIAATTAGGFNALETNWEIYARHARANDQPVDRTRWSLAAPIHIAETRQQAFDQVEHGIHEWIRHFKDVAALTIVPESENPAMALVESGLAVVGTPEDAVAQINRLLDRTGGFGTFLLMAHNWAEWPETLNSYGLFARHVATAFSQREN